MATANVTPHLLSRTPLLVRSLLVYGFVALGWAGVAVLPAHLSGESAASSPISPPLAYRAPVTEGSARRIVQGTPERIRVDRLGVDLPIYPGSYNAKTGEWTLSNSAAYFATVTDAPNDFKGSTFIYGHNRRSVFGPLAQIQAGDTVQLRTSNGYSFTYTYARDARINPDMTSILYEHPDTPQLVLMTCEGVMSATRRVMYFTLTGVDG